MPYSLIPEEEQTRLAIREMQSCNAVSERYGLALTQSQAMGLTKARFEALQSAGRIEFGEGVIMKLVYAFCDSPYVMRDNYADTLLALQDDFYAFKNEFDDQLSDDELIEGMRRVFHGRAQGSLEYLENMSLRELYRAALGTDDPESED